MTSAGLLTSNPEFEIMPGQRVISFSLFGDGEDYHRGALANAILTQTVYPGWICRVHVSDRLDPDVARRLADAGADVVIMPQQASYDGLFWRFLPADDSAVDVVIVRDADARLGAREKAAVDDWLASGKTLHIMRDHPGHRRLIPAGLWGCRGGALPGLRDMLAEFGASQGFESRLGDADFLERYVYPRLRSSMHVHSGFSYYPGETPVAYPVDRTGDEYLGCPDGRHEMRRKRLADFAHHRGQGPTLRQLPASLQTHLHTDQDPIGTATNLLQP
jgi:hypothetical protein